MTPPLMAELASDVDQRRIGSSHSRANRAEARRRQGVALDVLGGFKWRAHPEAYHGWLELPDGWSSAEFVMECRRAGVIVTPGDAFAVSSAPVPAVRISLSGARDVDSLAHALSRIARSSRRGPGSLAAVL